MCFVCVHIAMCVCMCEVFAHGVAMHSAAT